MCEAWHDRDLKKEKWKWFSKEDKNSLIDFEGDSISIADYDKRTPGKFKPEFVGEGMICLNSKVYHTWGKYGQGDKNPKTSWKGVQQKRNEVLKSHFLNVIQTQNPCNFENAGFVKDSEGTIKTYTQEKKGLSYFYAKRKVLSDGVTTTHLNI